MGHAFEPISGEILGAAVEVHRLLGPGYQESVYEAALCIELGLRGIPHVRQHEIVLHYKDREVGRHRLDLIAGGEIVLEVKAVSEVNDVHLSQALSYLKSSKIPVGLILNFGRPTLDSRRVVR
jgi:GxxExxY protein